MKKKNSTEIYRTVIAYCMLLLVSLTILPFSLFHHHSKESKICCTSGSCSVNYNSSQETYFTFNELKGTNLLKNCLFCAWQMEGGARLTYVISHEDMSLPDFKSLILSKFYFIALDFQAVEPIPNKGPPAFLFS